MIPSPVAQGLRAYLRHGPGLLGKRAIAEFLDLHFREAESTTWARTTEGAYLQVMTRDVIQRYLYLFGEWEPHLTALVRNRLGPGDTFIDVGANIGYYSLLASTLVGPQGRVLAVEPSPDFYGSLVGNLELNGCANTRAVEVAVSDSVGVLTLYRESSANLGNTSAVQPREVETSFKVRTAPLQQVATDEELTSARLIKIDVEGAESAVLRGLSPLLGSLRPDVELLVEVTPRSLTKLGESVHGVFGPLLGAGFHATRVNNDYAAGSYPAAMRAPELPAPLVQPVTTMTDVLFSRQPVRC